MTRDNSFVYFEDAVVSRAGNLYKVVLENEEATIFLKENIVNPIGEATGVDENLIAIVIANIEFVKQCWSEGKRSKLFRIDDKVVIEGLSIILNSISIDELILKIKSMKWHEILHVLNADSPVEEIEKL